MSQDSENVLANEAYDRILPSAMELPEDDIEEFRHDENVVYHNLDAATKAVTPHEATILQDLPKVSMDDIKSAPIVGLALIYVMTKLDVLTGTTRATQDTILRAWQVRRKLLANAENLSDAGVFPNTEIQKIKEGSGARDLGRDCVNLAELYVAHKDAIAGRTVITDADLQEARELGSSIQTTVRSGRMKKESATSPELNTALDIRDRIWTLAKQRYELIWKVGTWIYGLEAKEEIPSLLSIKRIQKREPE